MKELLILRGLPGSGKSTRAKRMIKDKNLSWRHIEADQFHMIDGAYKYNSDIAKYAHAWCLNQAAFFLNKDNPVIVSNTFVNTKEILPYIYMANDLKACIKIADCEGDYESIHNIPDAVMQTMKSIWMPLGAVESDLENYIERYNTKITFIK